MPAKKAKTTIKRTVSRRDSKAAIELQAPAKRLKFRQVQADALYENTDTQKCSLSDLSGVLFKITSARLVNTPHGESYVFNIETNQAERYHFFAKPDDTRDKIYQIYRASVRDGFDEVGWFTVEVMAAKQKGYNGYARISIVDETPF